MTDQPREPATEAGRGLLHDDPLIPGKWRPTDLRRRILHIEEEVREKEHELHGDVKPWREFVEHVTPTLQRLADGSKEIGPKPRINADYRRHLIALLREARSLLRAIPDDEVRE